MPTVFTPEHSPLDLVFSDRTTYIIPPYQRPYSWQAVGKSDQNNQVNLMWDDLWNFFRANQNSGKEYFLGSMVVIDKGQRTFEVIDGQQRLTTLLLLFGAMRCVIRACEWAPELDEFRKRAEGNIERFLFNRSGLSIAAEPKVRIQREGGQDFDAVLKSVLDCATVLPATDDRSREIAERYLTNFQFFEERLRVCFVVDQRMPSEQARELEEFSAFLFQRVALVRITTADFDTAYSIFEILNNRGLPLSGRDLLRNFMLKELTEAKLPDAAGRWTELERDYALTEDFIGRFVESRKAAQQRYSAFNDLVAFYKNEPSPAPGKTKAEAFYDRVREDLNWYSLIVEARQRISETSICNRVQLILESGNTRYSVNLLLALFRQLGYAGGPHVEIVDFLRVYQAYLFYILMAPGGVRFSNAPIYRAIQAVLSGDLVAAKNEFALDASKRQVLSDAIAGPIADHYIAKLLLACYVWSEDSAHSDVVEQQLWFDKATLEHIIPQSPVAGSNWLHDFPVSFREVYTRRLGNMTLLTTKMNSAARNFDFQKKREQYQRTKLSITHELSVRSTMTPADVEERHRRIASAIQRELQLVP